MNWTNQDLVAFLEAFPDALPERAVYDADSRHWWLYKGLERDVQVTDDQLKVLLLANINSMLKPETEYTSLAAAARALVAHRQVNRLTR